eukprot:Skav229871  [mRNA]  locus=scaffold247:146570:149919:+ [translate_table: standard]
MGRQLVEFPEEGTKKRKKKKRGQGSEDEDKQSEARQTLKKTADELRVSQKRKEAEVKSGTPETSKSMCITGHHLRCERQKSGGQQQ